MIIDYWFQDATLAIRVSNNNGVVSSQSSTTDLNQFTTVCGANKVFPANNTVQFVVTGLPSCAVTVSLVNQVYITLTLSATSQIFWTTTLYSSFIDIIAQYLGISYTQIKIVGATTS
jgi:hypothetical protein